MEIDVSYLKHINFGTRLGSFISLISIIFKFSVILKKFQIHKPTVLLLLKLLGGTQWIKIDL